VNLIILQCILVCSGYDVNEREKNEQNKKKKHLVALTGYLSFKRKAEKYSVSCATHGKGAEAFITNCMETILEAKECKYLYTY
jgi:hypothetical protein